MKIAVLKQPLAVFIVFFSLDKVFALFSLKLWSKGSNYSEHDDAKLVFFP